MDIQTINVVKSEAKTKTKNIFYSFNCINMKLHIRQYYI